MSLRANNRVSGGPMDEVENRRRFRTIGRTLGLVACSRPRRVGSPIAVGVLLLSLAVAIPAGATTFIVNSKTDTTDGSCGIGAGGCTLREAIEAAVATAGRDTIRFDPTAFPHETSPNPITLTSALPIIADPAGTVIDGAGASVRIDGDRSVENGLVFASAPGVPLAKVTLANVSVVSFTRDAVKICGGVPPMCAADVSTALVRNVFVTDTGHSGIAISGRIVKKARVIDSVAFLTSTEGILLIASESLVGGRVEGCTASRSGGDGIILSSGSQIGSAIVDSFALNTGADGIQIETEGGDVSKSKIANVVSYRTQKGILIDGYLSAPSISDAVASQSELTGIEIRSRGTTDATLTRVVADGNGLHGINLDGPITGGEIARAYALGNAGTGIDCNGVTAVEVSEAIAAGNLFGIELHGSSSVLDRVHTSANDGTGIRVMGGDGNTIKRSTSTGNGVLSAGIDIFDDSGANIIEENVALGNAIDLYDANATCDANSWSDNVFRTRSQPCIH